MPLAGIAQGRSAVITNAFPGSEGILPSKANLQGRGVDESVQTSGKADRSFNFPT